MVAALLWWFVTVWNSPPATLGEAAFREAVRRHHTPTSIRVINDETLGPRPAPAALAAPTVPAQPATEPAAPAVPEPPAKTGAAEAAAPVKDAAWWGARITVARAALARDRVLVSALESRVAALGNDIASRDDPEQRAQLMAARQQALAELDRLLTQVADEERAITAIEDDARKAGVPPGWIR